NARHVRCSSSSSQRGSVLPVTSQGYIVERSTTCTMGGMGIFRLNHAVLFVRDLAASVRFYTETLGFHKIDMTPEGFAGAAFLQAPDSTNDHDLGLFELGEGAGPSAAGRSTVGLYHLAWEVDTLETLEQTAQALVKANALVGTSDHGTTK